MTFKLPPQVQKKAEEALKAHKEAFPSEDDAEQTDDVIEDTVDEQTNIVSEESFNTEEEHSEESQLESEESTDNFDAPAEPIINDSNEIAELKAQLKKAEDKNKVLQGKYNAEVPALHTESKELRTQVAQMQGQIETLTALQNAQPVQEQEPTPLFTDKEREEYDPELLEMIERTANAKVSQVRSESLSEINALKAQLDAEKQANQEAKYVEQEQMASNTFYSKLDDLVPDWEQLLNTDEFNSWLDTSKDSMGILMGDHLHNSRNQLDAGLAAKVFEIYKGSLKGEEKKGLNPPASQVSPPRQSKATKTPQTKPKGVTYKESEIKKWNSTQVNKMHLGQAVFRGKRLKPAEASNISKDMMIAYGQGRVEIGK